MTELDQKYKTLQGMLRQAEATKNRLEKQMDELPYDDAMYERKITDLQMRCDKQYDTMLEIENEIEEVKVQLKSIREKQMTEENIYIMLFLLSMTCTTALILWKRNSSSEIFLRR